MKKISTFFTFDVFFHIFISKVCNSKLKFLSEKKMINKKVSKMSISFLK